MSTTQSAICALLALIIAGAPLVAQGRTSDGATCVIPIAPADSSDEILYLQLSQVETRPVMSKKPRAAAQRGQLDLLLQELRPFVIFSRPLHLPIGVATAYVDSPSDSVDNRGVPAPRSSVTFTLFADGRIAGIKVEPPARVPSLDSAFVKALQRGGNAGTLSGILAINVDATGRTAADSARFRLTTTLFRDTTATMLPLFRIRLPSYAFTNAFAHEKNPLPDFPSAAWDDAIDGEVELSFVVDERGRVDMGTVDILKANYREFVLSVLEEMPGWRYRSSTINGCPVRQLVQQTFRFLRP